MIMWKKVQDVPMVKLAAPDHKGDYPNVSIGDVFNEFIEKNNWTSNAAKWTLSSHLKKMLRIIKPTTKITSIKPRDIKDPALISSANRALTWYLNGKSQGTPQKPKVLHTNGTVPVTLKIQSAPIEMLSDLLQGAGKHLELRTQVLDAIATCPPDQIRIIQGTQEIIDNEKERKSIHLALSKSVAEKGFCIRWSQSRKVFVIVSKDALNKYKKGVK